MYLRIEMENEYKYNERTGDFELVPLPPSILTFVTDKDVINENDKVKVSWTTSHATKVYLNNNLVPEDGSSEIVARKNINLKATNTYDSVERNIVLKIKQNPVIISCSIVTILPSNCWAAMFSARLVMGLPCEIEWESKYVKVVRIRGKSYKPKGKLLIYPQDDEMVVLEFIGTNGTKISKTLYVSLPPININYIIITKSNFLKGKKAKVTWCSDYVSYVMIGEKRFNANDTYVPSKTGYFTLNFFGHNGKMLTKTIWVRQNFYKQGCMLIVMLPFLIWLMCHIL